MLKIELGAVYAGDCIILSYQVTLSGHVHDTEVFPFWSKRMSKNKNSS